MRHTWFMLPSVVWLWCTAGIVPHLAKAQLPPPPPAREDAKPAPFPALDAIERRQKALERQKFEERRAKQLAEIEELLRQVSDHDPEAGTRLCLQANKLLLELWNEEADERVRTVVEAAHARVAALPPPVMFQAEDGLDMLLIDSRRTPAFYMSALPVSRPLFARFQADTGVASADAAAVADAAAPRPVAQVTWHEATAFCSWLSEKAGTPYRLPTASEVRDLDSRFGHAFWTSTPWEGPASTEFETRRRFGVTMITVWDPEEVLASGQFFGEVPNARHGRLGFAVVTAPGSGVRHRLNRLRMENQ